MEILGLQVERPNHACIRVKSGSKTICFDPFQVEDGEPSDLILISHEHYDHCSPDDIRRHVRPGTVIMAAEECAPKLEGVGADVVLVKPGDSVEAAGLRVEAVRAYNTNKFKSPGQVFHPKSDGKCGFVVDVGGIRVYHAGDTDMIPEMKELGGVDVALLPVSGTYVMTPEEAAEAVGIIRPRAAVPMHYGAIVGTVKDAERFRDLAGGETEVIVL